MYGSPFPHVEKALTGGASPPVEHRPFLLSRQRALSLQDIPAALATNTPRFEERRAQVLVIPLDPLEASIRLAEEMALPFSLLSDSTGEVVERFTDRDEEGRHNPPVHH